MNTSDTRAPWGAELSAACRRMALAMALGILVLLQGAGASAQSRDQIEAEIARYERQQSDVMQEIASFAFSNPVSTACGLAGMGTAASLVLEQVDPDLRNMVQGGTLLCVPYCLFADSAGCLTATKVLGSAVARYGLLQDRIDTLRRRRSTP